MVGCLRVCPGRGGWWLCICCVEIKQCVHGCEIVVRGVVGDVFFCLGGKGGDLDKGGEDFDISLGVRNISIGRQEDRVEFEWFT